MATQSVIYYHSASELPLNWDVLADTNLFLRSDYLKVLDLSAPLNMRCVYIGLYENDILEGIAISQFLDLNLLESFGERDKCFKTYIRNFLFKRFSSHVLFIGNNMLSGQNAFSFSKNLNPEKGIALLQQAARELGQEYSKQGKPVHLLAFKDFEPDLLPDFKNALKGNFLEFSTQPNMVFEVRPGWLSFEDYVSALSKKYRDQYKRAHKKAAEIQKRKMHLEDIIHYEDRIYALYHTVAKNAPFNTFFLAKNHFSALKQALHSNFLFYGYFLNDELIGFNTLIKNGETLDTYFLGYDENIQREKMLYLNMLYDMIGFAIHKGFKKIVFARTALEIKSSVGAAPQEMIGFMQHKNAFLNRHLSKIFQYVEPETKWQRRHPFKDLAQQPVPE